MKRIGMLVFVIMMMAIVTAAQAALIQEGPRAGALPAITVDDRIKECAGPCPEPVVAPVPEPVPVVVPPPPPPAPKPVIIEKGRQTLDVKFDFDKATIKKGYFKDIDDLVGVMKQYPDLNVVIEGHTDNVGTAAYNKKLSQKRAEAVTKYMVESGINANRIRAIGFGLDKPVASNETIEGQAQNRRVEAAVDYIIEK
jgi:OOP family OmpA-OmpF porin